MYRKSRLNIFLCLTLSGCFAFIGVHAQAPATNDVSQIVGELGIIDRANSEEDIEKQMPSLDELLKLAIANFPNTKLNKIDQEIAQNRIKTVRRVWLNDLGIEFSSQYGLTRYVLAGDQYSKVMTNLTGVTNYGGGFYIKLPLGDFIDGSKVKTAKKEYERSKILEESVKNEVSRLVIDLYFKVISNSRVLQLQIASAQAYKVQAIRSEKEYIEGIITNYELARLIEMYTSALMRIEEGKAEFMFNLKMLEELTGVKLLKK